jgi:hypothetical protein
MAHLKIHQIQRYKIEQQLRTKSLYLLLGVIPRLFFLWMCDIRGYKACNSTNLR